MTKIATKIIPYYKEGRLTGFKIANETIYIGLQHGTFYKGIDVYLNECRDIVISAGDTRIELLGGWEHLFGSVGQLMGDLEFETHWSTEEAIVARQKKEDAGDLNYAALNRVIAEEEAREHREMKI